MKFDNVKNIAKDHNEIPNSVGEAVAEFESNIYNIRYTKSGNLMAVGLQCQDVLVLNSFDPYVEGSVYPIHHKSPFGLREHSVVSGQRGQWTQTDLQFYKEEGIASTTLSPFIELSSLDGGRSSIYTYYDDTGFLSLCFTDKYLFGSCKPSYSSAQTHGHVVMWDLNRKEAIADVPHGVYDANAVIAVDNHLIASGGDDSFIKLWDTRLMGGSSKQKHVGFLTGHTQGITSLDSFDGYLLVSNGKDQKAKIFDLRFASDAQHKPQRTAEKLYDYRWEQYRKDPSISSHPNDMSIVTFLGHSVYATMIKARFSPCGNYVYSGSSNGAVYIWDKNGDLLNELEVGPFIDSPIQSSYYSDPIVRDCQWHPNYPVIYAGLFSYANVATSNLVFTSYKQ